VTQLILSSPSSPFSPPPSPDHARYNPRSPFKKGQGTRPDQRSHTYRSRRKVYCSSAQNCCVRPLSIFHRLICMYPMPTSPVSDPSIQFLARQSPGIDLTAPFPPTSPPHPFPSGSHTRYPHQAYLPLTTSKRLTQTSFLVDSRYPLPPTRAHDPIRNSTTQTPVLFRCAIIKTLRSRLNVARPTSPRVLQSYLVHNSTLLSARMRSSASCSIIARTIPFVSHI
jgi:hypothetical protein